MEEKFLVVSTSILPEYMLNVVKARDMVESGEKNISQACLENKISRSTYYKYKDCIFKCENKYGKKSIFGFKMADQKGVLSNILAVIYELNCNVIAINQSMTVKNNAYVTITIDMTETSANIKDLSKKFKQIKYLKSIQVIAFE